MEFSHYGKKYEGKLEFLRYQNGNLVVRLNLDDGEPYATLSVNVEGIKLADNEFVAKTYSENEGLVEQFIEKGHFIPVSRDAQVGLAGSQPIFSISPSLQDEPFYWRGLRARVHVVCPYVEPK
jgi:hypothetical protein